MQAFLALTFMVAAAYSQDFSQLEVTVRDSQAQEGKEFIEFFPELTNSGNAGDFFTSASTAPEFTYSTIDGTAKSGLDYVAAARTEFGFDNDSNRAQSSIKILLVNDVIAEPTKETFSLSIATSNTAIKVPAPGSVVGTIIDDENLTVDLADAGAIEGVDQFFAFDVTLSHAVSVDFNLALKTVTTSAAYSAREGVDYNPLDGNIVILPGTTSQTFSVNIIDDNIQENLETFEVQVSYDGDNSEVAFDFNSKSFAVGTFNAETEGVTICIDSLLVAEGASQEMSFSVTVSHAVGADIAVKIKTVEGTTEDNGHVAVQGSDGSYLFNQETVTFAASEVIQEAFPFYVTVMNDNLQSANSMQTADENFGPLNFGVEFSIDSNVFAGSVGGAENFFNVRTCSKQNLPQQKSEARAEIYDFEDVTISLTSSSTSMSEAAGVDPLSFSVALSHYVLPGSGVKARGASFQWVDSNTATPSTGDATLAVAASGTCAVETMFGSLEMNTITGPVDLCWPAQPKNVGNGKAVKESTEYAFVAPLSPVIMELIRGPEDFIIEGSETFTVGIMLTADSQSGYSIRAADGLTFDSETNVISTVLTLTDNEPDSPFTISPITSVAEANLETLSLGVTLTHSVAVPVSIQWNTEAGTATEDSDYNTIDGDSLILEFEAFSKPDTTRSMEITIVNDDTQELSETFSVVFSNALPASLVTLKDEAQMVTDTVTRVATITDNEGMTLSIADMTTGQDESQEQFAFNVTLSHKAAFDVSVSYSASVSADTPQDPRVKATSSRFDAAVSQMLFPTGSTVQTAQISVVDDDLQTGDVASVAQFQVTVDTANVNSIDLSNSNKLTAHALLTDNEGVTVSISDAFATEGLTGSDLDYAQFTVALSHKVSEDTTIAYHSSVCNSTNTCSMTNGSTLTGQRDFIAADMSTSLTVPAYEESSILKIKIMNDNVQEFAETFSVTLESVTSGLTIDPTADTSTATIFDNEFVVASIKDAPAALEGNDLSFKVELSHKVASDVTIFYQLNSGSAVFGTDFSIANSIEKTGSVTIPASEMGSSVRPTATIVIKSINDNIAELAETFTISLRNVEVGDGDNTITILLADKTDSTGTGTIGDLNFYDEDITVAIMPSDAVDRETSAVFSVVLSHAVDDVVTVSYQTHDKSAVAPDDYSTSVGTLVFPANKLAADATFVPAPMDITVPTGKSACQQLQENKTFKVSAATPSHFRSQMGTMSQIGTIKPFDHKPTVTIDNTTANEGSTMEFTVSLSVCIADEFTVGIQNQPTKDNTRENNAYLGVDFMMPGDRTLTFAAKALTQKYAITTTNNNVQGLTKEFFVEIGRRLADDKADDYNVQFINPVATGTITDAEDVTISITQCVAQRPSVNEAFKFTVTLSHAVETLLELSYTTEDTTAVGGIDFFPVDGSLQYTVGRSGDQLVTVTTINRPDVVQPGTMGVNAPTRFDLKFSAADEDIMKKYSISYNTTAIGKGAILGKNSTNVVLEQIEALEGTRAKFTAVLADEISVPVVVQFEAIGSVATAGRANTEFDLGAVAGTFTFQANAKSNQAVSFEIELYDDYLVEPTESFDIKLTVLEPAGFQGTVINFDGVETGHRIIDNDFATLAVSDATSNEDGDIIFSVVLSHKVYEEVSVAVVPSSVCGPEGQVCIITDTTAPAQGTDRDLLVPTDGDSTVVFSPSTQISRDRVEGGDTRVVSFRVLNDDVLEPTETFLVTASTSSALVGSSSDFIAIGTIADDEGAYFIFNSPSGAEGDDMIFTVSLSHEISASFSVPFKTQGEFPKVFTNKTDIFTLHPYKATNSFVIKTVNNNVLSATNVTFEVKTFETTPPMIITQAVAVGTLAIDDEDAYIIVTCDRADENAATPTLNFITTLQTATTTPFKVQYGTRDIDGQARAGVDYTAASGTFEFTGDLFESKTVEVAVIRDDLVEEDEMVGFDVTILTAAYKPLIDVAQVDGVIVDNEGATIEIRDARVSENEGAELMFTVFLSHEVGDNTNFKLTYNAFSNAEANAASSVNMDLASGDRGGKDYDAVTGASSERFAGDRGAIKVPIYDDYIVEVQEMVQVEVTSVNPKFTLSSASAFGIIGDNDFATVSIASKEWTEAAGEVQLTVTLSHLTQPDVSVSYKTIDGFATSFLDLSNMKNKDYESKDGILTFPSAFGISATDTRVTSVSVEVVDDALVEEAFEDFCVSLRDVVSPANIGIQIDDDARDGFVALLDDMEAATISIDDITGNEGDTLQFVAVMSHGIQAADFDVAYTTVNLSAKAGAGLDYKATAGTVTFASSVKESRHAATPYIEVATYTDAEDEYNELFEVKLTEINNNKQIQGVAADVRLDGVRFGNDGTDTAFGTINDNRGLLPQNELSIDGGTATEGQDEFIEFIVYYPRRTKDHTNNNEDVAFTYQTFGGSAIHGRDFNSTKGAVNIPGDEEHATIRVPIIDNTWVQGNHEMTVVISSATKIGMESATGTIIDDDVATVTIGDGVGAEMEGGTVVFPVTLSHEVESQLTFSYATRGAADDITKVDATFQIGAGQKTGQIVVDITNDNMQEDDEEFDLDASNIVISNKLLSASSVTFMAAQAKGTISDDEGATVSIGDIRVLENVGEMRFELKLSHEIRIVDNKVEFSVTSDSAVKGTDMNFAEDTSVTFSPRTDGQAPIANFMIKIEDDAIVEGDEVFTVVLQSSTKGIWLPPTADSVATVTIVDDDFATVSISDVTGKETDGTMDFQVTLSHEVAVQVSVTATTDNQQGEIMNPVRSFAAGSINGDSISIVAGFAAGSPTVSVMQPDFLLEEETLTLNQGQSKMSVVVYDDTEQECDEKFLVSLSNLLCGPSPCGEMVVLDTVVATGTLTNDNEGLTILGTQVEHSEGMSPFEFTLTLSHAIDYTFDVTTSIVATETSRSRLIACTDTTTARCTELTKVTTSIPARQPWKQMISVDIRDDIIAQAPGLFEINVVTDLECAPIAVNNPKGIIMDNEEAKIEIMSLSALEDGDHPMTVTLSHAIEADLTVGFLVDGDGVDFDTLSGDVKFTPASFGQSTFAQIDVRAETVLIETDKTYDVSITNIPAWLSFTGAATLTIVDDEIKGSFVYASTAGAMEGEMMTYQVYLLGEHENALSVDYAFVGDTATAGADFMAYTGDLYWPAGDMSNRTIKIPTLKVAGCDSDKIVNLVLSGVTGGSALANKEASQAWPGVITDSDGATVSVSAPAKVVSGTTLAVTAQLSSMCDVAITVPITVGGAAPGTDFVDAGLTCTILANTDTCTINVETLPGAGAEFSVAVASSKFEIANTVFSMATVSSATATGTIAVMADARVTAVAEDLKATVVIGMDFAKTVNLAQFFNTDTEAVTYSVETVEGMAVATIAGDVATYWSEFIGDSVLTVTATTEVDSASVTFYVAASMVQTVPMNKLARSSPVVIRQGEYYQRLVTKVLNDPVNNGNFEGCAATGNDGTLNDCCVVASGFIQNQVCERSVVLNRALRLESIRLSLYGAELGESEVCMGSSRVVNFYPALNFCFMVSVVA